MCPTIRPRLSGVFLIALGFVAAGCGSPTAPMGPDTEVIEELRVNGILLTANVRVFGDKEIEVTLTAMNETDFDAQTQIRGGNCMLLPRVYSQRGGGLIWSAFDLFDGCQEPLKVFQLGGGDEDSVSGNFTVDLDSGSYFVTLTIQHSNLVELAAGQISLP